MHARILKHVGVVLVAVSLLIVAVTIYLGAGGRAITLGLGAITLAAGVLLLRGDTRAAWATRMLSAFGVGATVVGLGGQLLMRPPDLILAELRLQPLSFLLPAAAAILAGCIQIWVMRELGREPVQTAIAAAGLPRWPLEPIVKAGGAVMLMVTLLLWLSLHGTSASVAMELALRQLGPDYRYALTSISSARRSGRTEVSGVVTAWNDHEIRQVLLHWQER